MVEDVTQSLGETRDDDKKHWSVFRVIVTRPWIPATNAEHTQHYRLRHAFLLHAIIMLVGFTLVISLSRLLSSTPESLIDRFTRAPARLEEVVADLVRSPFPNVLTAIFVVETTFVAVALLVAPWGARDEPMRSTYANALRQTWLHTPHVVVATLGCATVMLGCSQTVGQWNRGQGSALSWWSDLSPSRRHDDRLLLVRRSAAVAQVEYWMASRPWWSRYNRAINAACFVGALIWVLWGLLRAVGAPRVVGLMPRPPTCDRCGYNLSGTPPGGRCSECGTPVIESLGPDVRPGSPWDRRRAVGWHRAFLLTSYEAVMHPVRLTKQLPVIARAGSYRIFMRRHAFFIFVFSYFAIVMAYAAEQGWPFEGSKSNFYVTVVPGMCASLVAALFALCFAVANMIGLYGRVRYKRNLLGGAMQAAAYLSALQTVWVVFAGVSGVVIIVMENERWFDRYTSNRDAAFYVWSALNLVWLVAYVVAVARGTAAMRFAEG